MKERMESERIVKELYVDHINLSGIERSYSDQTKSIQRSGERSSHLGSTIKFEENKINVLQIGLTPPVVHASSNNSA